MLSDFRLALRLLIKERTFALTALLTLAVTIGANTAIFSIVRSVLLRPLPVPQSERLVQIYNSYPNAGYPKAQAGVPDYFDRRREMDVFEEQALFRRQGVTLGDEGGAHRLNAVRATPSFFRLARVESAKGRIFTEQEGEEGQDKRVLLSFGFWQQHFAGAQDIVGRDIRLNGQTFAIVGVLPRTFTFLWNDIDLFLPASFTAREKSDESRHSNNWNMVARLKSGATIERAQQQLDAINARNDERFPQFRQILKDAGFRTFVVNLQDDIVGDIRPTLYLLWGGVLFVLLIGCVNIANLVVVRSAARSRELATRHAMGAGLLRLSRQLITETITVSLAGGVLGLVLGWWALRSVTALRINELPRGFEIAMDPVVVGVALGLSVLVGFGIGLVPVAQVFRINLNTALREEGRSGTSGRRTALLRRALATAQVAIACLLLVGAGLMLASFRAVLRLDPGFVADRVLTASVSLPAAKYADDASVTTFSTRALERLRALPGLERVGFTSSIPYGGDFSSSVIKAEGYVMKPGESLISPMQTSVSDGYFEAMGIRLIKGRFFDARDTADATKAIIVDERLAAKFWPGQDPIGRRTYTADTAEDLVKTGPTTKFFTVVGVVSNVQMADPNAGFTPVGGYYYPLSQASDHGLILAMKTTRASESVTADVRAAIAAVDPELAVYDVHTMADRMDQGMVSRRVPMMIALSFGGVALMLAAIGIYGVLAYGVAQRRREIGIRLALGSSARDVFGLVLGEGARIVAVGLLLGLVGAYFIGQAMASQLYETASMDPLVIGSVALLLSIVAFGATVIPARRASKVNPASVLLG